MKIKLIYLVLLFLLACPFDHAQAQLKTDLALSYIENDPGARSSGTVIILLHGVGSNEQDLFNLGKGFPAGTKVISARAPYKLAEDGYGWFHISRISGKFTYNEKEAEKSRKTLLLFIDQVKKKYKGH